MTGNHQPALMGDPFRYFLITNRIPPFLFQQMFVKKLSEYFDKDMAEQKS